MLNPSDPHDPCPDKARPGRRYVTVFLGAFCVPSFSQVLEMPLLLGGGIPTELKQELQQNFGTGSVWSHWPQLAEG